VDFLVRSYLTILTLKKRENKDGIKAPGVL
jgi:hypothetical protein